MSEYNKSIARQFFEEYIKGNLDGCVALLAPNFVFHQSGQQTLGTEDYRQLGAMYLAAFPDLSVHIEDQIADGDRVVTCMTYSGTHEGDLMGIPPTGRRVVITAISIDRIVSGKIAERWDESDTFGLFQQLGVLEQGQ